MPKLLHGAVDEFLAEGGADVDIGQRLAVAHMIRVMPKVESASRPGSTPTIRLAGLDRFHHRRAPRGSVVAEQFWRVDEIEARRRGLAQGEISGMPCAFIGLEEALEQLFRGHRGRPWRWHPRPAAERRLTAETASAARPLVVDRATRRAVHVVQLELLDREPAGSVRAAGLMEKTAEDGAGDCNGR